jgi:hypothetical protein
MSTSDASQPDVIVGELTLLDGRRESDAAHMKLLTPPRRAHADRRPETLLVFLDVGTPDADGLARAMLQNFEAAYWRCSGPVTSALRKAIAAANDHLREENRLMPVTHRRRAGLVCAVLRDEDVYLAQIGPAKALFTQDRTVTRFPKTTRDQLPLGVSSGLDIRYSHSRLKAGDSLLLTGEQWSAGIPDQRLSNALTANGSETERVILELERQVGDQDFSALVVGSAPLAATPRSKTAPNQRPMSPAATITDAEPPQGVWPAMSEGEGQQSTWSEYDDRYEREAVPRVYHRREYEPVRSREKTWPPSKPLAGFSFDREHLARSRQRLQQFGMTVGDSARTMLLRVLPEPEDAVSRARRRRSGAQNIPLMAGIAIAIPLLVAFVVVTFYLQRSGSEHQAVLANEAISAIEQARQTEDGDAISQWESALLAVDEALQTSPDDLDLTAMRAEAQANVDRLANVSRTEVRSLWEYGSSGPFRLAASRMQVFVLDEGQDQITRHNLDASSQSITGDEFIRVAYGDQNVSDQKVGGLRDMVWLGAGGAWLEDVLLILTADNNLLQHNPSWGLSWVPFQSELSPGDVRAISPYDGRLYVLDTVQNQIWRFVPDGEGFGSGEHYFRVPPPDLSSAVDMTIDGAIYVLLEDGTILKFFNGEGQPFEISGLPQPLEQPVALDSEGDADSGALYVADAGTQSVMALSKSGAFIHQIQAQGDILADLQSLAIEAKNRTLYLIAHGELYVMDLPSIPERFNQGQ